MSSLRLRPPDRLEKRRRIPAARRSFGLLRRRPATSERRSGPARDGKRPVRSSFALAVSLSSERLPPPNPPGAGVLSISAACQGDKSIS